MAITLNTAGSWAYDSSGSITVTLPTHATGDMLLVRVAIKSGAIATCTASTATSGWAKVGQFAGATNSGNGTGSVLVAVFWKEAASAAEASPTIDFTQTNTQGGVVAMSYQKASTEGWLTPVGDGGLDEGTANTSHSATIASHVSATVGDLIDFFTGIRDDTTMTVPTFTQAGATLDAVTESPAVAGSNTAGDDGAYDGGFRTVTAGTSSAAAVVTGTLSTSEQGTSWTTRLRVQVATDASAGNAAGTGTANLASITIALNAGNAAGSGSAFTAAPGVGPSAGLGAGSGAAFVAAVSIAPTSGVASGTGTANQPAPGVSPSAGLASGNGAAFDATVSVTTGTDAAAGVASGSGTAFGPSSGIGAQAGSAAGTGQSFGASLAIAANAGNAVGTGAAYNPTISTGAPIAWGLWSDVYCNPVGVVAGHPGRRPLRLVRAPARELVVITGTVDVVIPAPMVATVGEVNDDEVVLELLAGLL